MTVPFLETVRFPDDMAVWARGGVSYNTSVTGSTSGREQRNPLWTFGRGQWDLQNTYRTPGGVTDPYSVQRLRNLFRVVKGQAYGFRFRDWTDYADEGCGLLGAPLVSYSNAPVPSGTGNGTPTLQLYKQYAAETLADYRLIAKPQTVQLYRNGNLMTQGTGAGQAEVDTTTGLVTFFADNAEAIAAWTVGSSTQFQVPAAPGNWVVGTTLFFSGITGDTNGAINGLALPITSISGTTITVGANTTGETLGGGTASRFPQPTDELTWTGTFDTPVRFSTDQFSPQLDVGSGALYGFQTLQIVEIRT